MFKNTPYRRTNDVPITKDKPYIQLPSQKDNDKVRKTNNRKGNGLVVAKIGVLSFAKYRMVKQQIKNKTILHSILVN
jgi:hypothetical protein